MSSVQRVSKIPEEAVSEETIVLVPVQHIRPNPNQPRKHFDEDRLHELRISMRAKGQRIPIFLKPVNDEQAKIAGIKYEIVDGERRWRAASMEGSDIYTLKAIIEDTDDIEQFLESCALNYNREGHTPHEEILMVHSLINEYKCTQNYICILLGKSQSWVSQRALAYQRLDNRVMQKVQEGRIPISVATKLSKLNPNDQVTQMHKYLEGGTVTDVSVAVRIASDAGNVQGGVRKPDLHDDKKYVLTSRTIMKERCRRLKVLGPKRLQQVAESLAPKDRAELLDDLSHIGREIVNLMVSLKAQDLVQSDE